MARFFFNLCEDGSWTRDLEGQDLAGIAQVRRLALQRARAIIADDLRTGVRVKRSSFVAVEDSHGKEVCRIVFGDVLKTS